MDQDTKVDILSEIAPLVRAGVAIHWLRPRSKAPADSAWSTAPVASLADLRRSMTLNANVGVRLGEPSKVDGRHLHLIDIDIRNPAQATDAWNALRKLWPSFEQDAVAIVMSGSGGESRHVYFLTDKPFRSRKLAHSGDFKTVWDSHKGRDVKHWDWEIELFGTGKQAVLPPSIHPDTGQRYTWIRPLNLDLIDMGLAPAVPSDLIREWAPQRDEPDITEPRETLGYTKAQIEAVLGDLPLDIWCEDRDGWLQVGMALHHETSGSDDGLAIWNAFSSLSSKFVLKDQIAVWKSFRDKPNSVRLATLVKAAKAARYDAMLEEEAEETTTPAIEDADPFDLLGEAKAPVELDIDDLLGSGEPAAASPNGPAPDPNWKEKLDRNDEGAIKPTLHNVELIVRNDARTRGTMALNQFTQEVVQVGEPGTFKQLRASPKGTKQLTGPIWKVRDQINGDIWTDAKDNAIRAILEAPLRQGGYAIKVSDRDLKAAVDLSARDSSFHPVRQYLEGLSWDGEARLDTMFIRYLGVPDSAYSRGVARLVLLGAVTRVFEPGHKFDFVAILEGIQGKRKSTFIATLARHWYSELSGNFHDRKEMVERMQGSWILELPELQGFTKGEVQDIKAFVSAPSDKVRLAYARRADNFERQCIFIGSTNEAEYLRDNTGGRRFWPITCQVTSIDIDGFAKEVDQLWAEATALYRSMRQKQPHGALPLYLSNREAEAEARELQESRRVETVEDGVAGQISAWLERPISDDFPSEDGDARPEYRVETCLLEIWVECLGNDRRFYDQKSAQMIGRAMKLVPGWKVAGAKNIKKYGRQRAYWKIGHFGG